MSAAVATRPLQPSYSVPPAPLTEDIPEAFTCPISGDLMRDPVRIADGTRQCYEREEIQKWFDRCGSSPRSPMTNLPLRTKRLTPADDMRQQIEARASAPSAPPMPVDGDFYNAGMPMYPAETGAPSAPAPSAPPMHPVESTAPLAPPPPGPSAAAPSAPVMPSAPPAPTAFSHDAFPEPVKPPRAKAVGATAKDFANVSALARRDLQTAIKKQGTSCLTSVAAATLGAAGGLMVGGFAAAGFAMGTLLVPCAGVAAGLALVGAGSLAGHWLRQRLTGKAQHEPQVAAKLTALTEMRSAFEGLDGRNRDEDAALAHVKTALGDFDKNKSLRRHFTWAAGAALIAIPVGVGATLYALAKAQENKDENNKSGAAKTPKAEASAAQSAATTGLGAAPGASAHRQVHHHMHYHYHSAPLSSRAYWSVQDWVNPRPAAPPPMPSRRGVRVDMQPRWLKALDPQSYARMCDMQGARP